ncbi:MAG: hypothetical protein LM582_09895 [Desulfurococcaceae archaeon]|nr:hypothetical protein [Desulfurococcaceae archaeon]
MERVSSYEEAVDISMKCLEIIGAGVTKDFKYLGHIKVSMSRRLRTFFKR